MKVIKVLPAGFASNSYLVTEDGENAVVIDPAQPRVADLCARYGLTCRAVLLTHGHFDHVGGCGVLYDSGARILCGEREKDFIKSPANRGLFGGVYIPEFEIDRTLTDGEEITLCDIKFRTIATPGHTAGSVCYVAGSCLFSGDTLFCGSAGRTDLPTGDSRELVRSLKKLFALEGDYTVYCGHEDDTTLEYERKCNPFARF